MEELPKTSRRGKNIRHPFIRWDLDLKETAGNLLAGKPVTSQTTERNSTAFA
jgi:hypothetical protein